MERLSRLTAVGAIGEWSEAQVSEWISLIDLPDGCAEAVCEVFGDVDGDELVSFVPKTVQKMLRRAGVEDPEPVAAAILRQRDTAAKARDAPASAGEPLECPFCMEPYADDDSELHVPSILRCGHTGCQGCFTLMLRPVAADGDYKKLVCPDCRVVTEVLRGKASNLPKNFSLLR